jgi:aminocarboxymuconate-semialdehyde decarboxylase
LIVDVHAHLYPEAYVERLASAPELALAADAGGRVFRYRDARIFSIPEPNRSPAERLAEMDAAGVDVQVLSLGTPNVYVADLDESRALAVLTNDILAEVSRTYPTRFRALASLPLGRVDDALRELERAVTGLGLDGVQLGTTYRGEFLDAPRFAPLLAALDRLGRPVFLHPVPRQDVAAGRDYALCMLVEYPVDTALAIARLVYSGLLDRYPRIPWLLSHVGGVLPFLQGRLDFGYQVFPECRGPTAPPSAYLRRLYYDTVSSNHPPALACAVESVGAGQLLFGTDCPHNAAGAGIAALRALPALDDAACDAILGGTARRLFPALAAGAASSPAAPTPPAE